MIRRLLQADGIPQTARQPPSPNPRL